MPLSGISTSLGPRLMKWRSLVQILTPLLVLAHQKKKKKKNPPDQIKIRSPKHLSGQVGPISNFSQSLAQFSQI
jgi:hypothetical protein